MSCANPKPLTQWELGQRLAQNNKDDDYGYACNKPLVVLNVKNDIAILWHEGGQRTFENQRVEWFTEVGEWHVCHI